MRQQFHLPHVLAFLLSVSAYLLIAYFTPRDQFYQLFFLLILLFFGYVWLVKASFTLKTGLLLALCFRLLFIGAYPRLSDDYFRFIWDGLLLKNGENPFLHIPAYYMQQSGVISFPGITEALFSRLNSPDYFSVYPPVCQFIFWCASSLAPDNYLLACLVMRLFILGAEIGNIFLILRLLPMLHLPEKRVWWYAFNPLVIIELTGNLHFEALLIFFLLASIYFLVLHKNLLSAALLGFAIGVKLLPLMLLPLIWRYLGLKAFVRYVAIVVLVTGILFLPFLTSTLIQNIFNSLDLYFQKFEFNASIYYIFRWLGYKLYGYNQIKYIGPLLSMLTFAGIIFLAIKIKPRTLTELVLGILGAFTLYFLLATIVHPWYITTLVAVATLTPLRYPFIWSGLVMLSYAAYQTQTYTENIYLVIIEYMLLFGVLGFEWWQRKKLLPEIRNIN